MSEELIRRSDAINAIHDSCFLDEIEEAIYELPTIEPKRGKWIEINTKDYKALCSCCGTWSPIMGNFCPNCGARMKGADDEMQ